MNNSQQPKRKYVELSTDAFGDYVKPNGEHVAIKRFTWKNANRIQVQVITYGATIISIRYPNKKGIVDEVLLGFEDLNSCIKYSNFNFGSTIGRVANVVKNASFSIMKKEYSLKNNFGKHQFNGGERGFHQVVWNYTISGNKVIMTYLSPDNDEGYPGDLLVSAIFELTSNNEFKIEYKANTTKPTIVNIANHCFFNLAGHSTGEHEIKKHLIMMNADCHTVTGDESLPTGEIQSVLNTPYDLQIPVKVSTLLNSSPSGFDKNLCVNRGIEQTINFIGRIFHPTSGRILEVYSNQPGIQIDTANILPVKSELAENPNIQSKTASNVSPYLRSNISTFDIMDEIYNKVVDIKNLDLLTNYDELLEVIQDLQKKASSAFRASETPNMNNQIKRSSLTLESLLLFHLNELQVRFIERILKSIETIENKTHLQPLVQILEGCVKHSKPEKQTVDHNIPVKQQKSIPNTSPSTYTVVKGRKGVKYCKNYAIGIQCQNYPDAINNPKFPSPILKPGSSYTHTVIYRFWIKTDQSGKSGII